MLTSLSSYIKSNWLEFAGVFPCLGMEKNRQVRGVYESDSLVVLGVKLGAEIFLTLSVFFALRRKERRNNQKKTQTQNSSEQ